MANGDPTARLNKGYQTEQFDKLMVHLLGCNDNKLVTIGCVGTRPRPRLSVPRMCLCS